MTPLRVLNGLMQAVASLKLTVVLFALGIFVIFVGTLAQAQADIWQVVRDYFHAWVMWVDVNLFFPPGFFPNMPHLTFPLIPAPGGMTVGVLMAVNLLAAHGWRFTIQASGMRLAAGLAIIAVGILLTVLVIVAGHNDLGFQAKPPFSWPTFWTFCLGLAVLIWTGGAVALTSLGILPLTKAATVTPVRYVVVGLCGALLIAAGALIFWGLTCGYRPADEALRIVWQLLQGGLGGLVLLVGCVMVFRKRGGIVLLHAGIGLMMVNELLVARQAVEWQIVLHEGQTTNFLRDIRTVELAIIDPSAKETDEHTVIPYHLLDENARRNAALAADGKPPVFIKHPLLQVEVAVLEYHKNATVRSLRSGEKSPATTGHGTVELLDPQPVAKGTDMGGHADYAGAYVRFRSPGGDDLGTHMLSQLADEQPDPRRFAETVSVGGKEYQTFLRFKRSYRPYTVSLIDVRKDDYVASDTPRNYSSDMRLVDAAAGVDQPVHIKMNDPLRYRGETFYQSNYERDPVSGVEMTGIQVVRNRIWMIPYVACMIVAIGLCAHFLITVTRFISRRENEELAQGDIVTAELAGDEPRGRPRGKRRHTGGPAGGFAWSQLGLPSLAVGLFLLVIAFASRPPEPRADGMDLDRFGRLPVAQLGRIKPFDTLARNSLQAISNRDSVKLEDGKTIPAIEWLLDVATGRKVAGEYRVVRIDHPELLKLFELEPRPGSFRYSVEEIQPHMDRFLKQLDKARELRPDEMSVDQKKLLELDARLKEYVTLVKAFSDPHLPELPTQEDIEQDRKLAEQKIDAFRMAVYESGEEMKRIKAPQPIPLTMPSGTSAEEHWHAYPNAVTMAVIKTKVLGEEADPITLAFFGILSAYRDDDPKEFNKQLARYEALVAKEKPPLLNPRKVALESAFNHFAPFTQGMVLYLIAFLLAIFGWLFRYRPLGWTAFTLILLTFALHAVALGLRVYISGRPPVTNLYSSAFFIGLAAVLAGLVIEAIFRIGLGNILSAVAGYATLLIASYLALDGDNIAVMQAVLDTQFWLATHVVCITLGYAATLVAGLLGLMYVIFGLCTPLLNERSRKDLGRMIYGVVCFAILFSFVGTVLGGLWADDSWGRFWGWDPKENGALIIVMWNALVLHARWDKMIADRGLAVLALGGNIVTAWSWFGVNQLGIGLHSYGFTSGVLLALGLFVASQIGLIVAGSLPKRLWWSFTAEQSGSLAA